VEKRDANKCASPVDGIGNVWSCDSTCLIPSWRA